MKIHFFRPVENSPVKNSSFFFFFFLNLSILFLKDPLSGGGDDKAGLSCISLSVLTWCVYEMRRRRRD